MKDKASNPMGILLPISKAILLPLFLLLAALPAQTLPAGPGPAKANLDTILEQTAQYCEKLKKAAFHFMCSEHIHERIERTFKRAAISRDDGFYRGYTRLRIVKPKVAKNKYINEYQIIQQDGKIRERRVMTKQNGKKVNIKNPGIKTELYSFKSSLAPVYFFAAGQQKKFNYRIAGKERVMGRPSYKIEVRYGYTPESPQPLAQVWIDRKDFSVLMFKLFTGDFQPERLAGHSRHNVTDITVGDIHYFGKLNGGVRFPSRTELLVTYKGGPMVIKGRRFAIVEGMTRFTKIKTVFEYKKYIFFDITVGTPIYFK